MVLEDVQSSVVPVILAGGSGTRLWPVSTPERPKQFQVLTGTKTPFQETVLRASKLQGVADTIVVTSEAHLSLAKRQAGEVDVDSIIFVTEPIGRDSAPAIALAAHIARHRSHKGDLLVMPSDHVIADEKRFEQDVDKARIVASYWNLLVTFGIAPNAPETGYGYIQAGVPMAVDGSFIVDHFIEKPALDRAEMMVQSGHFHWNSGIFMLPIESFLDELEIHASDIAASIQSAYKGGEWRSSNHFTPEKEAFSSCRKLSIDYAVMEPTDRAAVVVSDPGWSDVGSWRAIGDLAEKDDNGNVLQGNVEYVGCSNSVIRSDSQLTCVVGIDDAVVVNTGDAVLVTTKDQSQLVKRLVEKLNKKKPDSVQLNKTMHRPWGSYTSVNAGAGYQVKHISVDPGERLSLQYHNHRSEHWTVVSGLAQVTVGNDVKMLGPDDSVYIPVEAVHRLENPGTEDVHVIEVQCGDYLGEDDIVRLDDTYGRATPSGAKVVPLMQPAE